MDLVLIVRGILFDAIGVKRYAKARTIRDYCPRATKWNWPTGNDIIGELTIAILLVSEGEVRARCHHVHVGGEGDAQLTEGVGNNEKSGRFGDAGRCACTTQTRIKAGINM